MARAAVLITHYSVFSIWPTVDDLHRVLAKYQRSEVLVLLAKLNCILGTWKNQPDRELDSWLCRLVFPTHNKKIEAVRGDDVERLLFSRLTILYLVKQACLACPAHGDPVNNQTAVEEMGVSCLMANDLVLTNRPSPRDSTLDRLASLLPFCDYVSHDEYPYDIARSLMMFEEIAKAPVLRERRDSLELEALFQKYMGLSLRDFCVLVFGASARYLNLKLEDLEKSPDALFLRPDYFRMTNVPPEVVQEFFRRVAASESEFARQVAEARERPGDDLTIVQRLPFIELLQNLYICLDPGFLVDKAGRGLFWALFSEIQDDKERLKLASFWGAVFEEYLNSILASSYSCGGQFLAGPRFANGDQAFDACLFEDGALVVFEHKSSVLRADAKYSGDTSKLAGELRRKFILGDDEGVKGLGQLERSIRRFLEGEAIEGLGAKAILKIYPVLVCLDRSLLNFYMNQYLDENFPRYSLRKEYRKIVTPIFTIGVSEVERLLPYLHEFPFSEILESYYHANRTMLSSISSSDVPILKGARRGKDPIGEKFSRFAEEMQTMLFGKEQNPAPSGP